MSNSLEVISSGLFVTNMGIDGAIPCSSGKILTFSEWDVLALWVLETLGKTKVNNIDIVFGGLITANEEIVWLNITMNDSLFVHFLNSLIHLQSNVKDSSQVKFSSTFLEKILKTLTKLVHDHDMVHLTIFSLFVTNKVQVGNKSFASEFVY